eukprot:CAMPEP_0197075072 /NCGR_PEP_ID=MMETSP1384-20130603/211427_1 /TAXON_ID=29189 /ORGANISM="Ammonia sp." /LENGTH=536 /DNA_ID=CAMNT_0042513915 /DNA_START=28 /DNA_END=1639 /DNA_ORIENTATION=-
MADDAPSATQPSSDHEDKWLREWLKLNNLSHLFQTIKTANLSVEELSQHSNERTIRQTAQQTLQLTGTDLDTFTSAVIKYKHLQSLMRRNDEVQTCIDSLEFTKNELDIKRSNDILYIQEKFKQIMKTVKKRESILIRSVTEKMESKKTMVNEQIGSLQQYQSRLQHQHKLLMDSGDKPADDEYGGVDESVNAQLLLNETIKYDKNRFDDIDKMSVEIPNYDDIIAQIKRTGIILDEFEFRSPTSMSPASPPLAAGYKSPSISDPVLNANLDDPASPPLAAGYKSPSVSDPVLNEKLDCLCGTQLVLTNVACSYDERTKIYCNFCNFECALPHCGDIWHCPRGDIKIHPGGFDLCYLCGSNCFEARNAERRRKKEERRLNKLKRHVMKNRSSNKKSSGNGKNERKKSGHNRTSNSLGLHTVSPKYRESRSNTVLPPKPPKRDKKEEREQDKRKRKNAFPGLQRHNRSYSEAQAARWENDENNRELVVNYIDNFMYPSQLKKLTNLGYDAVAGRQLIIKHKGDMNLVMAELHPMESM